MGSEPYSAESCVGMLYKSTKTRKNLASVWLAAPLSYLGASVCQGVYETKKERDPGVLYLRDTVPNDKNVLNHNVSCDKKVAQIHVWHCIVRGKNGIHLGVHRIGLGWRVLHS